MHSYEATPPACIKLLAPTWLPTPCHLPPHVPASSIKKLALPCPHHQLSLIVCSPCVLSWHRKFPRAFMWGTATSAHQVEGAYLDDGKGLSIWDAFTHAYGKVSNGATADISCCHYYRYGAY